MSCNDVDSPLKMKICYCDVNPGLAKSESKKTPDLCNGDDDKIPCDLRPGFNGTVFNEPYITYRGKYYDLLFSMKLRNLTEKKKILFRWSIFICYNGLF